MRKPSTIWSSLSSGFVNNKRIVKCNPLSVEIELEGGSKVTIPILFKEALTLKKLQRIIEKQQKNLFKLAEKSI